MNERCPAKDSKCRSCDRYNHWESVCRQKNGSGTDDKRRWRKSRDTTPYRTRDTTPYRTRDTTPYRTHEDQGRGVNSISHATGQMTENFETMAFDNVKVGADTRDEVYATLNIELKDRPKLRGLDAKRINRQNEKNELRSVLEWYPAANDVGEMFSSLTPVNSTLTAF